MQTLARFNRSKSGRFLILYLLLAAGISAAAGSYFYNTSLRSYLTQKDAEKATALKLVDAFVTTYSRLRDQFGHNAPVPATFRAQSIDSFNKALGANSAFLLRWVGRRGRQIATPPVDPEMATALEEFAAAKDRLPKSTLKTIDNRQVLRTIYPSFASEESCVTCHNQLQPTNIQWRLNDVMGAFAIDIPADAFLQEIRIPSYTLALGLFLALGAIGVAVSILHFRQSNEREFAASQLRMQNIRFDAALNNMSQGLCMFDANKRLVVCNERYARIYGLPPELLEPGTRHEDIIGHRVRSGILSGERTNEAVNEKLAALGKLSSEVVSTRTDKFADGRMIKVTRGPLAGGGWVATHEDVTEQAQRASIDSAIS